MRRVAITGIGAVTPLGNTFRESWEAAKNGRTVLRRLSRFNSEGLPWKMAGELQRFDPGIYLGPKELRRLDRFVIYAVAASFMAAEDAGIAGAARYRDYLSSGGVAIGSGRAGISSLEAALRGAGKRRLSPYLMPATTTSMAASYTAQKLGLKGYCLGISNACASGASAIGEAWRLIRGGFEGPLLAGGSEAPLCRVCLEGYGTAGALSRGDAPSASRPFDRNRDGFVLAEGACVLVLEEMESALERGAGIYGEIAGYSCSCDAFDQTKPHVDGEARAMAAAIDSAGLKAHDIGYISAHGTSTTLGDRAEAGAIKLVFGERAAAIPVSAVKSMTGHMLAASGALEAAFTAMSLKEGVVPPTINLGEKDDGCDLNIVTGLSAVETGAAVSNSFGFGGVNAVLVLKRPQLQRGRQGAGV